MTHSVQNNRTADQVMRERHAVKKYDASYQIPEAELNEMLELAATAPSSWNLQHWKLVVITDQELKEKLLPICYGQRQVVEASAVILVLGDVEADQNAVPVFKPALEGGFLSQEIYDTLLGQINAAYHENSQFARDEAIRNSSYLAMQLMLAARAYGYDTCPMGGFDKDQMVQALNVPSRYIPSVLITLGKAAEPAHPSTRFGLDQLVIKNSF